jgi:hypothetical protein
MGTSQKYLLRNLGGGINQGLDPATIGDNDWESLENTYPWHDRQKRRRGLYKVTKTTPWDNIINAMFDYKTGPTAWTLILGGQTKLGKVVGSSVTDISRLGGGAFTSSTDPWVFKQYQNVLYACRTDGGTLQRCNGLNVGAAGITAPATAATLAQGAAGSLGAGDYIGVVTFGNTDTGAESDPSPVTNTLTLAASKQIDWTGIPLSTNQQTNCRHIYRTLAGQTGEYYWVGTIYDNTTTTFTDNVIQDDMGSQASFENGAPPNVVKVMEIWNERGWLSDGVDLYFSELGLVESYSAYSVLPVKTDDGHAVEGILGFGHMLLVGKGNAMHYVVGFDESDFDLRTLSNRHGCRSHHSMQTGEGLALWFGGDNFYKTDGNTVRAIGDINVRTIVDSIDASYYNLVRGAMDSTRSWYVAGVPADGASEINKLLVYNYRTDAWTTFTYTNKTPQFLGDFYDSNEEHIFYCSCGDEGTSPTVEGHVYQWDRTDTDDGDAIPVDILTKKYGFERDDIQKLIKDVALRTNDISEDITIQIYVDGTAHGSPLTFNLNSTNEWKRVPITNRGNLGTYLQLHITYSGTSDFELKGLQFKIVDTARRAKALI